MKNEVDVIEVGSDEDNVVYVSRIGSQTIS